MITRYRWPLSLLLLLLLAPILFWLSTKHGVAIGATLIRANQIQLGDVFAFTGANTHAAIETFNANANFAAGSGPTCPTGTCQMAGIWGGNPTLVGAILSSAATIQNPSFTNGSTISLLGLSNNNISIAWNNPSAPRTVTVIDPGGNDNFLFGSATQNVTGKTFTTAPVVGGTQAVLTGTGACATFGSQKGGSWGGQATCTGSTGASTVTITPGTTAPNGWYCEAQDITTRANLLQQTASAPTSCTLTATSVTGSDAFTFSAIPY